MERTRNEGASGAKSSKRKKNRRTGSWDDEELRTEAVPVGAEYHHIAQAYIGKDQDTATELSRGLTNRACRAIGVYRRERRR